MGYMEDFFQMQKNMYDSFQNMYSSEGENEKKDENDGVKNFYDMQKNMYGYWANAMNPFAMYGNSSRGFGMDDFANIVDMQRNYFHTMNKFYNNDFVKKMGKFYDVKNMEEAFNKFRDFYTDYDLTKLFEPNIMQVMDKAYDANKFYGEIYNFWNKINKEFKDAFEIDQARIEKFIGDNIDMVYKMTLDFVPEDMKVFLEEPRKLFDRYMLVGKEFYGPWMEEYDSLKDLYVEGMLNNDREKMAEFFRTWKIKYDETYGKLVSAPGLGVNKNIMEEQNKAFDKFVDLFITSSIFSNKLLSASRTVFENSVKDYTGLMKKGSQAKTFEEFYEFWSSAMDKYLIEYFGSEEFSKLIGEFGSVLMDYKIQSDRVIEKYLETSPIVTKGELDSMIKNIYNLKKEVKSLSKEVEELKAEASKKTK